MKKVLTWLMAALLGCSLQAQDLRDTLDASRVSAIRQKMQNTTQTGLMHIESRQLNSGIAPVRLAGRHQETPDAPGRGCRQ